MEQLDIQFCRAPDGYHLAHTVFGRGPYLIMPPGWVSHLELLWAAHPVRAFFEKLARHHTMVLYDKHGCGLSDRDRDDFTLEKEKRDLNALMDHLGLERFDLLGISCGGAICIAYAIEHPDRIGHLLLYGSFSCGEGLTGGDIRDSMTALVKAHWGMGSRLLADLFIPDAGSAEQKWLNHFQRQAATSAMAANLLEATFFLDVRRHLVNIRTPTLVIHRKGDRVITYREGREVAALIPGARLVTLEGIHHFPWDGDTDQILAIIHEYFGDVPNTGRREAKPPERKFQRKLAALLSADVKGYSRLMGNDEAATVKTIIAYRELIFDLIGSEGGRVVDSPGDNILSEFISAVDALRCAIHIQRELRRHNQKLPDHRQMHFRIGINVGDVIEEEEKLYGDGVNIAARVEGLAEGGGIAVTGSVCELVKNKIPVHYEDYGFHRVKNIQEPIKVYRISGD